MKTRAREWALDELLKAIDKKRLLLMALADNRKRAEIDQECVDVSDEVKEECASEHEVREVLNKLDIEALDIRISCLEEMLITNLIK